MSFEPLNISRVFLKILDLMLENIVFALKTEFDRVAHGSLPGSLN
jgi:hypothetical protein